MTRTRRLNVGGVLEPGRLLIELHNTGSGPSLTRLLTGGVGGFETTQECRFVLCFTFDTKMKNKKRQNSTRGECFQSQVQQRVYY